MWDHQEAAQPLCLLRLWALCLTAPVTTGFCSGAACPWELNWDHQMVPVSYGLVSNGAKIADAVSFQGRIWNSAKCAMFLWPFPTFSSLDETISPFLPNFFHCRGAVQHGCAGEELSTRWRDLVGCQQTSAQGGKEPIVPVWDWGGQNVGLCYSFVIGSSATTKSSWKLPSISSSLLPKPFALQNYCRVWFTKVLWGLGCEILWQKKAFQLFITSHILNHGKLV